MHFTQITLPRCFSKAIFMLFLCTTFFACYNSKSDKKETVPNQPKTVLVRTWATAPQLVALHNMPPEPGLANNSIRQIVRVSIGGDSIRLGFNNEFSETPVTMKAVQVAASVDSSVINTSTIRNLKFNGSNEVTIQPG